ncbi:MAG: sugar ABC transporter ATP-binding protein [Actinobacteria bacterium]|nr:sugar ABC transporter ATP-binding protein [Actinomycetota bacterium]
MEIALELSNISKQFGATRALDGVDLSVAHGEVHALLGENGSGKSTLIKVLAGVHEPEPGGRLTVGGVPVALPIPPGGFHDVGLSFVHQDLGLARPLTVLENLVGAAARADYSRLRVGWRAEAAKARAMLESYGVDIDPRTVVNELPPVGQALVAIARAAEELRVFRERTGSRTSVLVLDEPTVFLPEEELQFLFDLVREVVSQGSSVIFISHDLAAVRQIADSVTVLRDGKLAATASMADVTDEQIVEYIVGPAKSRELHEHGGQFHIDRVVDRSVAPQLVVSGLAGKRLRGLDFDVAPREIVGLAGLLGSGAEEVPYLLFGAQRATAGRARVHGTDVDLTRQQPAHAVGMGMSFIPADRNRDAIAREIEVDRNMMSLVLRGFTGGGRLNNRQLRSAANDRAAEFDVRPRRTDVHAGTLSGGNAQKVVLAKWLETRPAVLLLHEPTQGVDIAARAQIYRKIIAAADDGMSVVWVSSDFEELATTCTRVIVLNNGRATSEMPADELNPEAITARVFAGQQDADAPASRPTEGAPT